LHKVVLATETVAIVYQCLIIVVSLPGYPVDMSLGGRVYTITGAASGIGQAVAIRLAELGAAGLAISDLNLKGLEETKNKCITFNEIQKITYNIAVE
jgi:hypothetical protein